MWKISRKLMHNKLPWKMFNILRRVSLPLKGQRQFRERIKQYRNYSSVPERAKQFFNDERTWAISSLLLSVPAVETAIYYSSYFGCLKSIQEKE